MTFDSPNMTNRITTSGWEYDLAGNLIRGQNASGVWKKFEYDAAGRLFKVKDDSNNVIETFTYGASREKLVSVSSLDTTYYVWGGSSIIAEYTLKSGAPRYSKAYIYAGSRLLMTSARASASTEIKEFHHPDRLGTQLVTDSGAGTSYRQTTFPFGTSISAETTGNSNQVFTSYDRSASTGLDYAVNRTYSKGQSRFTQVDPIGMAAASIGNPQSNNLYAYTQNMPTDFVDPSGLNMVAFTMTVCLPWDGGPRICFEIIVHWMNIGGGGGGGGFDLGGGSVGGTQTTTPPKPKKVKCKQDKNGGDADSIREAQERAGTADLIVGQGRSLNSPEGQLGFTNNPTELLSRLANNPAFLYNTGQGRLHALDVGSANVDSRSRLWSGPGLGRGSDGMVRSLQVVVGQNPDPRTGLYPVYSDLDCINPAEGLAPLVAHGFQILLSRLGRLF